jgi:hypothetical protein
MDQGADVVASRSKVGWKQGQDALRDEVARVTALLRSIQDPGPHAVGQWNLGEVVMHLSQAWIAVPGLARQDLSPIHEVLPSLAGVAGGSLIRDMWDLADTTALGVKSDPERDPAVLDDRIEARAKEYLSECVGADPDAPRPWLVHGATVQQSTLTYHLLSETVMHGYDIAHAAGRTWRIKPAHAAMVLARFNIPIAQALAPRTFVNGEKAAGRRATYDLHIRGGIASISSSTTGSSASKNRRPAELTAISRPTPSRCSWCSGTGRVSGRRSPRASCWPGVASRGWDPSSGA